MDCCIECSAKSRLNLRQVFYITQRTVTFPVAPLFDRRSQSLTPRYVRILRRVFRLFDRDQDGLWSAQEMNGFQRTVYMTELTSQEIQTVLSVLREADPRTVRQDCVTEEGFLRLMQLFLQKDRPESNWVMLRQLHYDDDLLWEVQPQKLRVAQSGGCPEWSESVTSFLFRVGFVVVSEK